MCYKNVVIWFFFFNFITLCNPRILKNLSRFKNNDLQIKDFCNEREKQISGCVVYNGYCTAIKVAERFKFLTGFIEYLCSTFLINVCSRRR